MGGREGVQLGRRVLHDLPEITYVIFGLKGKCMLGEARLAAVRPVCSVCWDQ